MGGAGTTWKAVLGAIVGAAILLVFWVLPAEYGVDPTGFGRLTGLSALADPPHHALEAQLSPHVENDARFTLQPYESLEYKLLLEEEAGLVFSWAATAPLTFDFHAEPEDAPEGFAESFDAGVGDARSGTYVAPFSGEHGWYWQNRQGEAVDIVLRVSGFSEEAIAYRDGFVNKIPLDPE